jgi:dolichol-phosphate mannosyltransferase
MDLSIVIPTFNERDNVTAITDRIQHAMKGNIDYEVIFVDDSTDDTPDILENLSKINPIVKYVHRTQDKGLGTAVVKGFSLSQGKYIIVMDADLQHPPELLPVIHQRLSEGIEVVIPSRFVEGGSDGGLNLLRKFISWTARTIGRISIKRMRDISDCTGGYFGIERKVIEGVVLDPIGWKILIEVLVKGRYNSVHEIPYQFVSRNAGESKMSLKEQYNYLKHITKLVWTNPEDRRFYLFCLVGSCGVVVNLIFLSLLLHVTNLSGIICSVIASLIAMTHNYILNDNLTWKGHKSSLLWMKLLKFPQFIAISCIGILITTLTAQFFVHLNMHIILGQLTGIVISTVWNFVANSRWTWFNSEKEVKLRMKITVTQESVHQR